jgi:alanyl-tRNA synthetase
MRSLTGDELRSLFVDFFLERSHALIPSASLIPADDPTVLFTSAGMQPLVPYLLGREHSNGDMLVGFQKCLRTTDIDEVGDATHLTLFEMLGNWSLGAYFKNESIRWTFEFLTSADGLGIALGELWVTVFAGNEDAPRDDESAQIWRSVGVAPERIVYLGVEDNWWSAGPEGPCGPDTEIFVDTTGRTCPGEDEKQCVPGRCAGERFVEIWNNVFMTFNRQGEELSPLPKRNVDTGMGLERAVAMISGAGSVYDVAPLATIRAAVAACSKAAPGSLTSEAGVRALRILTDHLRTAVFVLGDPGAVQPSNQGAGYVLRRIIRRSARFCQQLDIEPREWAMVAPVVIDHYGKAYPELVSNADRIASELAKELERFDKTLVRGLSQLHKELAKLAEEGSVTLSGESAFHLYDTYGFPIELTKEIAAEQGISIDEADYERRLAEHREKSRLASVAAAGGLMDNSVESVRYHTATHLLHSALRQVIGTHVFQRGSNITKERLRFDFSHASALSPDEVAATQALVQEWIDSDLQVTREVMSRERARQLGAIGLFDERYSGDVSVYRIEDKSLEFCGGPHVGATGELGRFTIVKEQSAGAGIRRIRAILETFDNDAAADRGEAPAA